MNSIKTHEKFMSAALREAHKALQKSEVPVGAVLVHNNKIISRGHNCPISTHDPTAHAELIALRKGARKTANYRLTGTSLYVTLEPCSMCTGAMLHARVKRVVFGCKDDRTGACGSVFAIADNKNLNHRISIIRGVLEHDCRKLIQDFFRKKRRKAVRPADSGGTPEKRRVFR